MSDVITKSAHSKILRALDRTQFTQLAFDIIYSTEGDAFAKIIFLDRPEFTFSIGEAGPEAPYGARMFACKCTPGILWAEEASGADNWSDLANRLQAWTRNIRDELAESSPIYNEFEKFRKEMMEKIEKVKAGVNERFSDSEQTKLSDRLTKLEEEFKAFREKDEIREKEFNAIKRELKGLKTSLKDTPKKTWLRMASGKLFTIGQKIFSTPAGQKIMAKATDRLLGP